MGILSVIGNHQNLKGRVVPGSPAVKTSPSNVGAVLQSVLQSLIQEQRLYMPPGPKNRNIEERQHCNKFNNDFKNGPHPKKKKKSLNKPKNAWYRG